MSVLSAVALLVGAAALAVAACLLLRYARPKEGPAHHFQCPHCRQRFRCRDLPAQGAGWCPRCLRRFNLPAALPK
jgi:hypothetical protein